MKMSDLKECPICGSRDIGKGTIGARARMMPENKILTMGSEISAEICTNCGHILSMRVVNPEKFK